jgi:hypothetical protein
MATSTANFSLLFIYFILESTCSILYAAHFEAIALGPNNGTLISVEGKLEPGDEKKFIDLALAHSEATVVFKSNGGNLIAGIEIGRAIRLKGFVTLVPNDMHCASACALAWLGGRARAMSQSARIGFHAASTADNGEITAVGNAVIGAYLNQLGLPTSAIIYITEPAPNEMRWLTFTDAQNYGIDVKRFELEEVSSSARNEDTNRVSSQAPPQGDLARDFIMEYFEKSSHSDAGAIQYFSHVYAPIVDYYKKPTAVGAVIKDKRSFFKRWPSRKYELDLNKIEINCSAMNCDITGEVAWRMYSSERRQTSDGKAKIHYIISHVSGRPFIISEWSTVISRELQSTEAIRQKNEYNDIIMRSHNGVCTFSKIGNEPVRCSSHLIYAIFPKSKRVAYSIEVTRMNGERMLILMSGGKDYQPTLSQYSLYLDTLRLTVGSKNSTFSVEGICQDKMNDAGTYAFSTRCRAKMADGTVVGIDLGPGLISTGGSRPQ